MIGWLCRVYLRMGIAMLTLALFVRLTELPAPELVADDLAIMVSALLVAAAGLVQWRQGRNPSHQE